MNLIYESNDIISNVNFGIRLIKNEMFQCYFYIDFEVCFFVSEY